MSTAGRGDKYAGSNTETAAMAKYFMVAIFKQKGGQSGDIEQSAKITAL
jgi:hypothetical protein